MIFYLLVWVKEGREVADDYDGEKRGRQKRGQERHGTRVSAEQLARRAEA
jgi:hypothetical protein